MKTIIYGAGDCGIEYRYLCTHAQEIVAFTDSNPNLYGTTIVGLPVIIH